MKLAIPEPLMTVIKALLLDKLTLPYSIALDSYSSLPHTKL